MFPFPDFLQVHFDGKCRDDVTTDAKKECISIAVSGPGMAKEKFFGETMVVVVVLAGGETSFVKRSLKGEALEEYGGEGGPMGESQHK